MGSHRQLSAVLSVLFCQLAFSSSIPHLCPKHQSTALLNFKNTLTLGTSRYCGISYPKTRTWNMSRECCLWDGVKCDELSGHVVALDLSCSSLAGTIDSNSTLFHLSHLQRLNLSFNDFTSHLSPNFGRFSCLTHLDLSYCDFSGQIPSEISHLSKLRSLALGSFASDELRLAAHDFKLLLQNLTQLRVLDLSLVSISSTIPPNISSQLTTLSLPYTRLRGKLPQHIFHLPNLEVLSLADNDQLSGSLPKTKWNSTASLMLLELSSVKISGNLPESLGYLTSLYDLSLASCDLGGPIPGSLSNLTRLDWLDLHENTLNGEIPSWIFSFQSLRYLDLSSNQFSGQLEDFKSDSLELIPESLSNLPRIERLNLHENTLSGIIPSWVFSLQSLYDLRLSRNHFSGQLEDFESNLLQVIHLEENQLQGRLPMSIQNLVNLSELSLGLNKFSGHLDVSFFSNLKKLSSLSLSYNNISLTNENKDKFTWPESLSTLELAGCEVRDLEFLRSAKHLQQLDLSNNHIQGKIPDWAWSNWNFSLTSLNISHNMLTTVDSIPLYLDTIDFRSNFLQGPLPIPPTSTSIIFMSHNNLSGEIPLSICNLTWLRILDLGRNNLKGKIPQCLGNTSDYLEVLDMHQNNLSGTLPTAFSNQSSLRSLNLHGNKLDGKIPRSLANCKRLQVVDFGGNHLNDTFPMWLGTLPELQILSLRANKMHGSIETSSIGEMFPELRILDLSHNAFAESLPRSLFQHFKAMKTNDQTMKSPTYLGDDSYYQDSITVATKGRELELVRILTTYTTIDLSCNRFKGNIPSIIGDLVALRMLNLSHNGLQGHIPPSLGNLSLVESLDLSANQLAGEIPQQLASVTSLEVLNLSHNHLQGCIPQGRQFATFEKNSYEGNDGLRGFPVSKGCGGDGAKETNSTAYDQESDFQFLTEFFKAAIIGYGSGLCIGISIVYFTISTGYPIWLSRIILKLEHKIVTRWRKKQQSQRNHRRF